MKLLRYIPITLTFSIIMGILWGYYLEPKISVILGLLSLFLGLLGIGYFLTNKSFKNSYSFTILSILLFFTIGIASISFQNQRNHKNHYANFIKKDNKMVLIITKKLKPNTYYNKYIVNISQLNDNMVKGSVLLNMQKDTLINKTYNIGDKIYVKSKLKQIRKSLNPYQFNYKKYLAKQQIYHQISVKKEVVFFLKNTNSLYGFLDRFRQKINNALKKYDFKKEELAIINALLLGQRQGISKDLLNDYAGAGAMHILAVSGLHIGILLYLLNFLFKPLEYFKNGKIIKVIMLLISLWMYAFLAGLSPSVIRAVTMFTAITIGQFSNKKTSTIHSLFISMFVLLLIHPLYIFTVGFQLSYLAVFSIVFFYPLFIRFYNPQFWLTKKAWQLFSVSFSAQLGILPLSLYYFHQFPSLFFVSSMVIIPFLGLILGLGILIIIFALLDILPLPLAHFFSWIITKMNAFISFIAKQEAFLFKNIAFSILLFVTSYFMIISLFRLWKNPSVKKIKFTLISILLFQGALLFEKFQKQNSNQFILFNQPKKSMLLIKSGNNGIIYPKLNNLEIQTNYAITNYRIKKGHLDLKTRASKNSYKINNKTILIVDSLGIYNVSAQKIDYVILEQSPKINLNRLIAINKPELIIADASNYKSYKKRWQKTCDRLDIRFYDTSIYGAFIIDY